MSRIHPDVRLNGCSVRGRSYTMPNLTIRGYRSVNGVVLQGTNCSVDVGRLPSGWTSSGAEGVVVIQCGDAAAAAELQRYLRERLQVTITDQKRVHTLKITVCGEERWEK